MRREGARRAIGAGLDSNARMIARRSLLVLALAACGSPGHTNDTPDAPGVVNVDAPHAMPDASPDAPTNLGPFPSQPTVQNAGGNVLAAPHIVPVFFANDATSQATIEMFLAQLAQDTAYWSAISSEYGVGALTVGASVVATETPPTTDSGLQTIVTSHAGGTGGWPANTPNTIYAIFLPDGVTLTMQGGTSCTDFDGYHSETQNHVVYALMPRCNSMTFPGLQVVTIASSHEFLEASTDPHPFSTPAFNEVDDEHAIWGLAPGGELGDMCETARGSFQPLVGSFMVQRTWSNASAAAGHDPCVPVLATPYVEAATILPDITVQGTVTPGISIPLNTSKTIEVDLYSDAPTDDWTVAAFDVATKLEMATTPELTFTFDKTTGHNGDKLQLTVTRVAAPQNFGLSELMLASQVNGVTIGTWFTLVTE